MTVLDVLQVSTEFLNKQRIENPRLNAEHLLANLLGRTRMQLYLEFERQMSEPELAKLRELVKRRSQGQPLQHLLGSVEFCGHLFHIDGRAMVPRPETEELVELLKSEIRNPKSAILDVGSGSGVIALSLAAKFPEAKITALDISDDALALARENANRLGLSERVNFVQSDLLEKISERFDVLAANLPYIAMHDRSTLSREVLHDPEIALFGGERGDELIRRLITEAPSHLVADGLIALELALGQADPLRLFLQEKNFHDIETKKDYSGVPRFLFARYG